MKTSKDPRHKQRKQVVSGLFALSFTPQEVGKEKELTQIGRIIIEVLTKKISPDQAKKQVAKLIKKFPLYPEL